MAAPNSLAYSCNGLVRHFFSSQMAAASAESELMYLNNLNRTSEELVQSLEGVLVKLKTLNEGAAGAAFHAIQT